MAIAVVGITTVIAASGFDLRTARERAGLTQRALAQRSGVHQPTIAAIESGTRTAGPRTRRRLEVALRERPSVVLDRFRDRARDIVRAHGGSDPLVFGTVARGEDEVGSDIDLVVAMPPGTGLVSVIALQDDLEALLGTHVDIVSARAPGPVLEVALEEGVPL